MAQRLAPGTGRSCIKIWACPPHILHGSLYGIGTIVQHTLAKQFPCLRHLLVLRAIACRGILPYPLLHIGLLSHPRQLEQKVVGYGRLFYGLWGRTYTLDASILGLIGEIVVRKVVQPAHQTGTSAKIGYGTEHRILRSIAVVVVKGRTAIREEVEHYQAACRHGIDRLPLVSVPLPLLDHPLRTTLGRLHSIVNGTICFGILATGDCATFMERVHRVVLALAHNFFQARVIICGYCGKAFIRGVYNARTLESPSPLAAIGIGGHTGLLGEVDRHHTRESRQYGVYAQFPLAVQDFLCQFLLAHIPCIVLHATGTIPCTSVQGSGSSTAPPLQVVHAPPCRKGRTWHEGLGLLIGIVVLAPAVLLKGEELAPHLLQTYNLQRHVYSMQSHPVYFPLPAVPCPCGHGVTEGAIVQIVSVTGIAGTCFLLSLHLLHTRQVGIGLPRFPLVERVP